jgi:hypothetical protein
VLVCELHRKGFYQPMSCWWGTSECWRVREVGAADQRPNFLPRVVEEDTWFDRLTFCGINERAAFFTNDFSRGFQPGFEVSLIIRCKSYLGGLKVLTTTSEKCLVDIEEQYGTPSRRVYVGVNDEACMVRYSRCRLYKNLDEPQHKTQHSLLSRACRSSQHPRRCV